MGTFPTDTHNNKYHFPTFNLSILHFQVFNTYLTMPLKLGSNWKSVGIGTDMRRWAHGNARINFGFCKGDDNFGGRKRKELDDFLKSLGKQMTLTMYRMEDTERVRFKLREDRRREVREKA